MRVALAVKSAAMPDVLSGRDLLQGNGLSQAGGALAQIAGIVFGGGLAGFVPPFVPVIVGAGVLVVGALVASRLRHAELQPRETSFGQEASQVVHNVVAGLKEVASRAPGRARALVVPDAPLSVLGVRPVRVRAARQEPRRGTAIPTRSRWCCRASAVSSAVRSA